MYSTIPLERTVVWHKKSHIFLKQSSNRHNIIVISNKVQVPVDVLCANPVHVHLFLWLLSSPEMHSSIFLKHLLRCLHASGMERLIWVEVSRCPALWRRASPLQRSAGINWIQRRSPFPSTWMVSDTHTVLVRNVWCFFSWTSGLFVNLNK